jgi:arylsulfatase A-like enzyme
VTSDALRADHLSLNGYPRQTSPALDAFARGAWHFANAVTVVPKTGPSFATIFTGRHPEEHQVRDNFQAIPESLPVLAERLRAAGYRTAAFVGNPVLRAGKGFSRGFDHYVTHRTNVGGVETMIAAFEAWLDEPWTAPTFVWIHLMDPHGPYLPPRELLALFETDEWAQSDARVSMGSRELGVHPDLVLGSLPRYQRIGDEDRVAAYVARYDAEIRHMDAAFGRVVAALRRLGVYDESAILFTSDHGESLGEHDYYFEHGRFAYDATLRIPLLVKAPGQRAGEVVHDQVSTLDVLPTLLALIGLEATPDAAGRDLVAGRASERPLLVESSDGYPAKYHGIRSRRWKYVVRDADADEELYDLGADPGETTNLAGLDPDRAAELRLRLGAALRAARRRAVPPGVGSQDDAETLEQLEALGYVQ